MGRAYLSKRTTPQQLSIQLLIAVHGNLAILSDTCQNLIFNVNRQLLVKR